MALISYSKFRLLIIILFVLILWQSLRVFPWLWPLQTTVIDHGPSEGGVITPVAVSVYYEALCPDSKSFVIKHLLPAVEKAPKLMSVHLVPYGKATTEEDSSGMISFSCQHGPIECLANKVHACGLSKITDPLVQVKYVSCMIADNMNPHGVGKRCADELSLDWGSILACSNSKEGSLLLKSYGAETHALRPRVSFIPTVLLDQEYRNQAAILKNFFHEVCSMFKTPPEECGDAARADNVHSLS